MAFPSPSEFALKVNAGITSGDYFAPLQPDDMKPEYAPMRRRGDGSLGRQGLNTVTLVWSRLDKDQFDDLTTHWVAASGGSGKYYVRYWDDEASSGAGSYQTRQCILHPPEYASIDGQTYVDVRIKCSALGIV